MKIRTKMFTKLPTIISRQWLAKNPLRVANPRFIFNNSSIKLQQQQSTKPSADPASTSNVVRPTNLQKKILVWMGKYKSADQIPDSVQ